MDVNNIQWLNLYVILFTCFCFQSHCSLAADKISAQQSLSGDQTISSERGKFVLGFIKPGNFENYYIGIWYKTVSQQTVVWEANRDTPVYDKYTSKLTISNGNLVLFDKSNITKWSTNLTTTSSNSVEAVLLDEGNLVLRDGSNSSDPLWQSFDYPTHAWLPGSKLGLDKITGRNIGLTSWKNTEDPAPGPYSLQLDPNGTIQFFIIWRSSVITWTSDTWYGEIFSLIPETRSNDICNFSYFTNKNESYFTYSLSNSSIISQFLINFGGQIQQTIWLEKDEEWDLNWSQPTVQCDVYSYCGAFASCTVKSYPSCNCLAGFHPKSVDEWNSKVYSSGCERKTSLQCGNSTPVNGKSDRFLASHNMLLSLNPWPVAVGNAQECESTCLNNCSCTAYAYYDSNCSIWFGNLLNLKNLANDDPDGRTLYVRLAASEFSSSNNKGIVIGVVVGSIVILILLVLVLSVILRKTRIGKIEKESGTMSEIKNSIAAGGQNNAQLVLFSFKSILAATNNFSEANKLGEGGFGPVYKGKMPGVQEIAIKRLSRKSGQGLEEFINELKLIANLQHKYLVRLLGCCVEEEEKILIYEYMPNRSLDKFLFDPSEKEKMVWDKRFKIAEGVAQGLLYIHKFSRLKVIHRDLKASNILLDEAMNPKISDFGMARIFGTNQTEANTNRIMGTYGYMSPEYAFSGQFSEKSDVFSYGVFLLEIVSGKRNTSFHCSGLSFTLFSWAWELWKEGKVAELIDPSLKDTCCSKEAVKCIHVGLLGVQDDPIDRPTMSLVVLMLSSDTQMLPSPKKPAFHTRRPVVDSSSEKPKECSNNELTISLPTGR